MKLFLGFVAFAAGAKLSRENASGFLRIRRANEGWFSEVKNIGGYKLVDFDILDGFRRFGTRMH